MHVNRDDVARLAGVSSATVSRVINHLERVSPATRERVLDAMKQLNYQPNEIARSLVQKRTDLVGVVVPQIADGLVDSVINGIDSVLSPKGLSLVMAVSHQDPDREEKAVYRFLGLRVAGIIALPVTDPKAAVYYSDIEARGVPVVMFIRPPKGLAVASAVVDDHLGGLLATQHLIDLGHQRIAYVSSHRHLDSPHVQRRINGYTEVLAKAGGMQPQVIRFGGPVRADEIERLMQSTAAPTALVCSSDSTAYGIHRTLRQWNINVPQQISLTGYDNIRLSESMDPQLTTVDIASTALGEQAARLLLERLEEQQPNTPVPEQRVVKPKLVVRASTGPPPH